MDDEKKMYVKYIIYIHKYHSHSQKIMVASLFWGVVSLLVNWTSNIRYKTSRISPLLFFLYLCPFSLHWIQSSMTTSLQHRLNPLHLQSLIVMVNISSDDGTFLTLKCSNSLGVHINRTYWFPNGKIRNTKFHVFKKDWSKYFQFKFSF